MAVCNNELGQLKSALFFAKKGVELDEKNADFQYIYGDILKANGYYEEAILAYSKVIQLLPDTKNIWLDLAETFREYLDIEHAIEVLLKGIDKHPNEAIFYYRLTAYYLMKNNIAEAVTQLEKAIELNPVEVSELVEFYPDCINFEEVIKLIENI
jgi:tetratricopeptide (TPR) repeat protein